MSSQQDSYGYSDPNQIYYGDSFRPPVSRQSRSPVHSWPTTPSSVGQSCFFPSDPSLDHVGYSSDPHDVPSHNSNDATIYPVPSPSLPDTSYLLDHSPSDPLPTVPLPTVQSQDQSVESYATHTTADNNPYLYYYYDAPFGYVYPQHEYATGHAAFEPTQDYPQQPLAHGHQVGGGFTDLTPQTSQAPAPVYSYPSSTQLHSLSGGETVFQIDRMNPLPVAGSSTLAGAIDDTARAELLSDGSIRHSHPPPVAICSNQTFASSSTCPIPASPPRKRFRLMSADDEYTTGRRMIPRYDGAESAASASRRRSRSTSVIVGRGPLIPQERYTTSSITTSTEHPFIPFELENPEQIGIPIVDILNKGESFARIKDRTQAFSHMGKKTFTLRIRWPGYKAWSKTIAAMDWTKSRAPITRVKLAEAVATAVRDLFDKFRDEQIEQEYAQWEIGPNGIQLDQVCLVGLHHVSRGSWQPRLCLLAPRR